MDGKGIKKRKNKKLQINDGRKRRKIMKLKKKLKEKKTMKGEEKRKKLKTKMIGKNMMKDRKKVRGESNERRGQRIKDTDEGDWERHDERKVYTKKDSEGKGGKYMPLNTKKIKRGMFRKGDSMNSKRKKGRSERRKRRKKKEEKKKA